MVAVDDVSLEIRAGSLHGLIGPNGAGKSTLFNLVAGGLRPDSGQVLLEGRRLDRLAADARARLGIAIAFQGVRLFRGMTVLENAMVGTHAWTRHGFWEGALRLPRHRREETASRKAALAALASAGLETWAGVPAESLPLGRQRELQVARALAARPRLLLLDEPAAGLRAAERQRLADLLRRLREQGLTIALVEHDVGFVTRLADEVTVLDRGRVIARGPGGQIQGDPAVIAAYLGRDREPAGA